MTKILSKLHIIATVLAPIAMICAIFGGWVSIVPILVLAFFGYLLVFVFIPTATPADNNYWTVQSDLLDSLMPALESRMAEMGYGKDDYRANSHDCDDYSLAGRIVLHDMLDEFRPAGMADPIFGFSFRRDDGKRHRLFFVMTESGRVYIDNWRINGSMYRVLSLKEEANGRIV